MCDEDTSKEFTEHQKRNGISRRIFTTSSAAAFVALAACSSVADDATNSTATSLDVTEQDITIKTADGEADCYWVHPTQGSHAAVIMWPDIVGLRPAFRAMGKRLAKSGYSVLVVNPYYRNIKGQPLPEGMTLQSDGVWDILRPLARSLSPDTVRTDSKAFVSWLDEQSAVDTNKGIGTVGYCMSGPFTLFTAATAPERIRAVGTFHSGALITDKDTSAHLVIPKIKADVLIATAADDHEKRPEEQGKLIELFSANKLDAEVKVYEGAMHGWVPPDMPSYDKEKSEAAWAQMLSLFEKSLV